MAESQRLIALSLGKIAQSRGQRGGASLYKNLLVSTVLYKARHAFMVEHCTSVVQAKQLQEEQENVAPVVEVQQPQPLRSITPAPTALNIMQTPPQQLQAAPRLQESTTEDQENNQENRLQDSPTESNCAKCTKRRMSDVEHVTLDLPESPCKRLKPSTDFNQNTDFSSCTKDTNTSSHHEPMQTEQISNLVNKFNTGFSGFLNNSSTPSHMDNLNAQSDSFVSSCSTQVSSFSESLGSRPFLALTV